MTITIHPNVEQGSDAWKEMRRGILTASEMKLIITAKTLKYATNKDERTHLYELAAQRIGKYVEPTYVSNDMLRGYDDELDARLLYHEKISPTETVGFITNDEWGFTIGYSPDWLVGKEGQAECKGRRQKYQVQTFIENTLPDEYAIQVQTGLLVSRRAWCDFVSFSGGWPMYVLRVYPDKVIQDAIVNAATLFEEKLKVAIDTYNVNSKGFLPTERRILQEMF